eukprot:gene4082-7371_t
MKITTKKLFQNLTEVKRRKFFIFGTWNENEKFETPVTVESIGELKPVVLKSGSFHSAFLTKENKLYTFGENKYGQCCRHDYFIDDPSEIEGNFSQIALGKEFTLATNEDSTVVYSSGLNDRGQLGIGSFKNQYGFQHVMEFTDDKVKSISAGGSMSWILTEKNKIFCFGNNNFGELGLENFLPIKTPRLCENLMNHLNDNILSISPGLTHTIFLTESGTVYSIGRGIEGQLGNTQRQTLIPLKVDLNNERISKVVSGYFHNLALSETGNLYLWGKGIEMRDIAWGGSGVDRIQRTGNEHLIQLVSSNVVNISTGPFHFIFSKNNGDTYGVGLSNDGQLGFVETDSREITTPVLLDHLKNIESISCAAFYSIVSIKE